MHAVLTKLLTTFSLAGPAPEPSLAADAAGALAPSPRATTWSAAANISDSERALVQACQRGDGSAQQELYLRYARRVLAVVSRIAGPADAEEITQEVFLRALRGIHGFRGESQLSTWLYRLAVNAALTHSSRSQRHQRRHTGEDALERLSAEPVEDADPLLRQRLERAMAALPAGYRAVLVLHDIEGLQHEDIASILGVRVGTSKSQLHKARARMRELLESP